MIDLTDYLADERGFELAEEEYYDYGYQFQFNIPEVELFDLYDAGEIDEHDYFEFLKKYNRYGSYKNFKNKFMGYIDILWKKGRREPDFEESGWIILFPEAVKEYERNLEKQAKKEDWWYTKEDD